MHEQQTLFFGLSQKCMLKKKNSVQVSLYQVSKKNIHVHSKGLIAAVGTVAYDGFFYHLNLQFIKGIKQGFQKLLVLDQN
jgi:hypothetical protein